MLILITGATGAIGKKLTQKLIDSGHRLRILTRNINNSAMDSANIEYAEGELEKINSLNNAIKNVNAVIHLAGITHTNNSKLYFKINTEGTRNLINSCENSGVKKFIFIGSRAASRDGGEYAVSKLLAEKIIEGSDLDWIILKPAEVYGTGNKEAISKLINIVRKSPFVPVIGNGQYLLSPVHIDDLVQSILAALNGDISSQKTYIIAGPEELTYNALIDKISAILGVKRIKIFIPIPLAKAATFLFYILKTDLLVRDQIPRLLCKKSSDISPARKDLAFNPRTLEQGIKPMILQK